MSNSLATGSVFEANDAFAEHLLDLGYTEVTSPKNQLKGKREFRHPAISTKRVYFDYINIGLLSGANYDLSRIMLSTAAFDYWHATRINHSNVYRLENIAAQ